MVGARAASPDDAAAIVALQRLAEDDARAKRGGPEFLDGPPAAPTDEEPATIVGLIGDTVVGYAVVQRGEVSARLDAIFTHPDARGVGVGHAMLNEVSATASTWGCAELDSFALPGDRDTKNFFESHRMKSRLLIVRRSL